MLSPDSVLETAISVLTVYQYPLIFLGAIVEGPVLMMASGFFLHLGYFALIPLFFTLVLGDFVADIFWYWVGRKAAEPFLRRFGHVFGVTHNVFEKMEGVFRRHDSKILFISKVTMGFGFALATLMAAGAVRVPFRKYLVLNLLGGFVWTGFLLSLGYFLGEAYVYVDEGFRALFISVAAIIVGGAFCGVARFIKGKYSSRL